MLFRPYPKMASSSEPKGQATPGGTWVALEKIHGAQLVVAVQGAQVLLGKRKAWLPDHEPFFGWQLLRASLVAAALTISRTLGEKDAMLYLYGELFGGSYPHPQVPPTPGMTAVQTGIWYAPDLRWSPFDILVAHSEEDEGEFLPHREVEAAAHAAGLLPPPLLRRGTYAEVSAVPARMLTRVPIQLGLPPMEGNIAEGIVLKSEQRAPPSRRFSFKRKIEEFNESRFDESGAWDPHQRLSLEELEQWADRLVNPARIASAQSKCGRDDPQQVLDEVVLDVQVDLELAFPLTFRSLDTSAADHLSAHVRARALPLIPFAR